MRAGLRLDDRRLLYATCFLRALALGMLGVLLGLYLAALRFSPAQLGWVVGAGLAGAAAATGVAMFLGDRLGHRRLLLALQALGIAGGALAALASSPWLV